MGWEIETGPLDVTPTGVTRKDFRWTVIRNGERRKVVVSILDPTLRHAIDSGGEAALRRALYSHDPPDIIEIGLHIRHFGAGDY